MKSTKEVQIILQEGIWELNWEYPKVCVNLQTDVR